MPLLTAGEYRIRRMATILNGKYESFNVVRLSSTEKHITTIESSSDHPYHAFSRPALED